MEDRYEILYNLHAAQGALDFALAVFGDELAKRNSYRDLQGIDAVHFYLMEKHHWPPAAVRGMAPDDIRFALTQEMAGWTMPPGAVAASRKLRGA